MKFSKMVAASLLALASVPAAAADNAGLTVGATVYGPDGIEEVGKIVEASDTRIVLDTGKHKVAYGPEAFGEGQKGPRFGMTKADLDASIEKAQAESEAKLKTAYVAGAALYSSDGTQVGTIEEIRSDGAAVLAYEGITVPLGRDQFDVNSSGQLMIHTTAASLAQALAPLKAKADALAAALVPGATVLSSDGIEIGKVMEVQEDGNVLVQRDTNAWAVPKSQFTTGANGALTMRVTKAEFDAAVGA